MWKWEPDEGADDGESGGRSLKCCQMGERVPVWGLMWVWAGSGKGLETEWVWG